MYAIRVGKTLFVDCTVPGFEQSHLILRCHNTADELAVSVLNADYFKENRTAVTCKVGSIVRVTAPRPELLRFLAEHGENDGVWSKPEISKRRHRTAN